MSEVFVPLFSQQISCDIHGMANAKGRSGLMLATARRSSQRKRFGSEADFQWSGPEIRAGDGSVPNGRFRASDHGHRGHRGHRGHLQLVFLSPMSSEGKSAGVELNG